MKSSRETFPLLLIVANQLLLAINYRIKDNISTPKKFTNIFDGNGCCIRPGEYK